MADTLHPLAQPDPSSVIAERYALRDHLGSGGMADVFSAWDERLGREVAVKLYRNVAANPIESEQADRELRLLAELRHPGLIEVFDAGTVRVEGVERDYLVMELIDTPPAACSPRAAASPRARWPRSAARWRMRWPTCTRAASCTAT